MYLFTCLLCDEAQSAEWAATDRPIDKVRDYEAAVNEVEIIEERAAAQRKRLRIGRPRVGVDRRPVRIRATPPGSAVNACRCSRCYRRGLLAHLATSGTGTTVDGTRSRLQSGCRSAMRFDE
jgi:hypothetical protein